MHVCCEISHYTTFEVLMPGTVNIPVHWDVICFLAKILWTFHRKHENVSPEISHRLYSITSHETVGFMSVMFSMCLFQILKKWTALYEILYELYVCREGVLKLFWSAAHYFAMRNIAAHPKCRRNIPALESRKIKNPSGWYVNHWNARETRRSFPKPSGAYTTMNSSLQFSNQLETERFTCST
jgi:hypothetical protein